MTHEQQINVILRSCAHMETQNASDETSYSLNRIKHSNGSGVDWDRFEKMQVQKLDARSHDAHINAVDKLTQKAKSLPPDQQQSFLDKGMRALSNLNNFLSDAFSHLTKIVVGAIDSVKDLFHQVTSFFEGLLDKFASLIDDSINKVTNWANGAAHSIERWSLL